MWSFTYTLRACADELAAISGGQDKLPSVYMS